MHTAIERHDHAAAKLCLRPHDPSMNKPKTHDNRRVRDFLHQFHSAWELRSYYPAASDILTGALELKTAGDTSERSLSRQTLFHVLQWCERIDVESVNRATHGRFRYSTAASYAATARVASKSMERLIDTLPDSGALTTVRLAREELDAPFHAELVAAGLM